MNESLPVKKNLYFDQFCALYEASGKALNNRDWKLAAVRFYKYDEATQKLIVEWTALQMMTVWRTPEFTPMPAQALISEGWTRKAAGPRRFASEDEAIRMMRHLEEQRRRGLREKNPTTEPDV